MKNLSLILSLFLFISHSFAAKKADVELPDNMNLAGKELVLNGIGIRRATIFNVKVYVGGLYVLKKSQDANEIINAENPKHITMKFVRSVDAEDLQDAWLEGFKAAVSEENRKPMMEAFKKFNATMKDVEEGDSILINFLDQGVQVSVKGQKHPFIGDKAFSKALLSIWFINARDERLGDELLGKE
ncbi:MAG: hypothetical protein CME63_13130 [Halobacteriovoraceae bacterium]|nr:hypothetical protein [Halobacteriovoraceae bacterium]